MIKYVMCALSGAMFNKLAVLIKCSLINIYTEIQRGGGGVQGAHPSPPHKLRQPKTFSVAINMYLFVICFIIHFYSFINNLFIYSFFFQVFIDPNGDTHW